MICGILLAASSCIAATVHSDFENGSTGKVEQLSDTHFRIGVKGEADQNNRNRQPSWYHFRVDTAPAGKEMLLDMVDLPGEYNFKPNRGAITGATPPVISYDQKNWTHLTTVEYDAAEPRLRLRVAPTAGRFWIAHTPPYTNDDLARLRTEVKRHADAREEVIGKTPGGRDLLLWTISGRAPDAGKKTVCLMFRQHSWESGTSWVGDALVRTVLTDTQLRDRFIWKIYPMCDPDGVARGGVRFNGNGYDLNRNWDTIDPRLMPEIAAQHKGVSEWLKSGKSIDFFLTLHNTETAEYVEGASSPVGDRFFAALQKYTSFSPSRPLSSSGVTTTPGMKGRMTVVQGLRHDFKIPAYLMEQRIAVHPKLGRQPTVQDRLEFGKELAKVISLVLGSDAHAVEGAVHKE